MRVALVSDWYYPVIGGVASHMHSLALKLRDKGHDVAIVTNNWETGKEVELEEKGVELIKVEGKISPVVRVNLSVMMGSIHTLTETISDFDVVHAHHAFVPLSFRALSAAEELGIPSVLTTHTISFMHEFKLWKVVGKQLSLVGAGIGDARKIIAVSNAAAKFIEHFLKPEEREKVCVVPNGVDINRFVSPKPEEKERIKEELGINAECVVLYLSRMSLRKGPNILLKAFGNLLKELDEERRKNVKLIMAGGGEMLPALKAQAKILGIGESVVFTGRVDDDIVPKLFRIADVFVLPSITAEAFGMVILEAMASGIPVVATEVGGIPEIVKKSKCGILVEPLNDAELSKAVLKLLEDEELRRKMGRKGRYAAEKHYSWDVVTENVLKIYREVMEARS